VTGYPEAKGNLGKDYTFILHRSDAGILNDYFGERLAEVGFDGSYEPNEEGVLLECLIDALFPLLALSMIDPSGSLGK
jgi:hypothetical protein